MAFWASKFGPKSVPSLTFQDTRKERKEKHDYFYPEGRRAVSKAPLESCFVSGKLKLPCRPFGTLVGNGRKIALFAPPNNHN